MTATDDDDLELVEGIAHCARILVPTPTDRSIVLSMIGTDPASYPLALDVAGAMQGAETGLNRGRYRARRGCSRAGCRGTFGPHFFRSGAGMSATSERCTGRGKEAPATAGLTEQGGSGGPCRSPAANSLPASTPDVTRFVSRAPTSGHFVTTITFAHSSAALARRMTLPMREPRVSPPLARGIGASIMRGSRRSGAGIASGAL